MSNSTKFSTKIILLFLLPILLAASSAAASSWTSTFLTESTLMLNIDTYVDVAVGPQGTSVAVWLDDQNPYVWYCTESAGVWSAPAAVYVPEDFQESATEPDLAMGSDGTAILSWAALYSGRNGYMVVKTATLAPGAAAWSVPEEISSHGAFILSTKVGMDAAGGAVAIWSFMQTMQSPAVVQSAGRSAGGAWLPAQNLSSSRGGSSLPDLAVNSSGVAVAVWQWGTGNAAAPYRAQAALRDAGGVWSNPVDLSNAGQVWNPHVAVDDNGLATAVWNNNWTIEMAKYIPAKGWRAPKVISRGYQICYEPDIASDASGDLLISWLAMDSRTGEWRIHTAAFLRNGQKLQKAWDTLDLAGIAAAPTVAMSRDGSAGIVAWVSDGDGLAFAATFNPASGRWTRPATLGEGLYENRIAIAGGPRKSARAVWSIFSGNITQDLRRIMGAYYD